MKPGKKYSCRGALAGFVSRYEASVYHHTDRIDCLCRRKCLPSYQISGQEQTPRRNQNSRKRKPRERRKRKLEKRL